MTLPFFANPNIVEKFIREKSLWLIDKINHFKNKKREEPSLLRTFSKSEYLKNKKVALEFIKERCSELNKIYNFKINKISVRNQRSRWGSCSRKGNLSFNYKLMLLPKTMADYIVAHELCHLKEFNHSYKFWNLVEKATPEYKKIRKELKYGIF